MSVKTIVTQLEENITDIYNTHYWLYKLYEKINNDERWTFDIYQENLFNSIKMDDISVNIILEIVSNQYIGLKIESDRIFNSESDEMTIFGGKILIGHMNSGPLLFCDYINSFRQINIILRTYKFDKYFGKFVNLQNNCSCINHNTIKRKALNCIIKNNKNIITNCDTCVVCYESTTNLTCCNHVVCFVCLDRIAQSINVYDPHLSPTQQPIICPICRTDINGND